MPTRPCTRPGAIGDDPGVFPSRPPRGACVPSHAPRGLQFELDLESYWIQSGFNMGGGLEADLGHARRNLEGVLDDLELLHGPTPVRVAWGLLFLYI